MTSSEFSVEGTASVKDEMGAARGAARSIRIYAESLRGQYANRYDVAEELDRVATALEAAAPSRDQVSMGALREMVLVPRELTPLQKLPGVSAYVRVAGECRPVALAAAWTAICDGFASLVPTAEQGVEQVNRAVPSQVSADETGWLIELTGPTPTWVVINPNDYDEHWTEDASKAIRFARKQDAQSYIDHIGWTAAFPTQHMWCSPRSALTPPIASAGEEPTAWLIENNGKIIEAVRGSDVLAMRRQSFDYATFTPVYSAASLSHLYSRIGELERERDEDKQLHLESADLLEAAVRDVEYLRPALKAAEARLAEALEVLEPFAEAAEQWSSERNDGYTFADDTPVDENRLNVGHLRRARSFHSPKEPGPAGGGA